MQVHHNESVVSLQTGKGLGHGLAEREAGSEPGLDQMGRHLGVSIRLKGMPASLELALQRSMVFNDAVVHNNNSSGAVEMRVGVRRCHSAMSRPARMTDADCRSR